MKKLGLVSLTALCAALSIPAQSTTIPVPFKVTIALTPGCAVTTPADIALTYTGGQATASTGSTTFNVTCTNNMKGIAFTLDNATSNTTPAYPVTALTNQVYTDATLALSYTLTMTGNFTTATGLAQAILVSASMPANQAGACPVAGCTTSNATAQTATHNRGIQITF